MLKLESIKLSPGHGPEAMAAEAARILRIPRKDILSLRMGGVPSKPPLCAQRTIFPVRYSISSGSSAG